MKFIKFSFIGALGSVTNLFIFFLLSKIDFHYILNCCICFVISVTQNYIFNAIFTFEERKISFKQYIYYISVNIFGLYVNLLVLFLVRNLIFQQLHFRDILSQALGILSAMIINFLFSKYFVFKRK